MKRSFDNLARIYRFLESICFGTTLDESRIHFIASPNNDPLKALVLGDGDGRFSRALLDARPNTTITSIDISQKMLDQATRLINSRHPNKKNSYLAIQADALHYSFPQSKFDLAVLNFFLDCFNSHEANQILEAVTHSLKAKGELVFTDFSIPVKQPHRLLSQAIVGALYPAFRLSAGIQAKRLPQLNWPASLKKTGQKQWLGGLIVSQLYQKKQTGSESTISLETAND